MRVRAHITLPHSIYIYIIKRDCAHALKCGATRLLLLDMVYIIETASRARHLPQYALCADGIYLFLVMRPHDLSFVRSATRKPGAGYWISTFAGARVFDWMYIYIYRKRNETCETIYATSLAGVAGAVRHLLYIYCILLIWFVRGGRQTELNRERSLIMRVASREARLPGDASSADINQIYTEIAPTRDHAYTHCDGCRL